MRTTLLLVISFFLSQAGFQAIPERAGLTYENPKYVSDVQVNVRRYSRRSPYVLNIEGLNKQTWANNNVSVSYIFYEYLHNEYKRSFIEMHFKVCDLINKENLFMGPVLRKLGLTCPILPGLKRLHNLTLSSIPGIDNFVYQWPFEKGKVVTTIYKLPEKEVMVEAFIIGSVKNTGFEAIPERAGVTYVNPKYLSDVQVHVRRYSRRSPYFVNVESCNKQTWANNNVSCSFIFYEYLHNEYKRSFIEMHFKACDMINKENLFIGPVLRKLGITCPLLPGLKRLHNLTLLSVPGIDNFIYQWPFEKAKIVVTVYKLPEKERMVEGYIIGSLKNTGLEFIPERAAITYQNPKYLKDAIINVRRYSRRSPYMVNIQGTLMHTWGNNVSCTFIFYEFLHNEYKRSFIEMKYKLCDLVNKDQLVGPVLRKNGLACPVKPGLVQLPNMTLISVPAVDQLPYKWPFEKGKAVCKLETIPEKELLAEGYAIATFKESKSVKKVKS